MALISDSLSQADLAALNPFAEASGSGANGSGGAAGGNSEAATGHDIDAELGRNGVRVDMQLTADALGDRETRIRTENGFQQVAPEPETPALTQEQPAQERAPAVLAANQEALAVMDGQQLAQQAAAAPLIDFSSLLAGTGISLAAVGVANQWSQVPDENAMQFGAPQFAGQTQPDRSAGLNA